VIPRRLAAMALALVAGLARPAHAAEPWLRVAFTGTTEPLAGPVDTRAGGRVEAGVRWLVLAAAFADTGNTTHPSDRDGSFYLGLGGRLQPLAWTSLEALGTVGLDHYRTNDVNLRGWYGPSHLVPLVGLRVQATAGPRFELARSSVFRTWAPVLFAAHAWHWSRRGEDRFRSWGGASRWVELGFGVEFTAR